MYQETLLHKILIKLTKIEQVVRFGTHWYGKWYGARLSVPYVPFAVRHGTVVRLERCYALGGQDD